MSEQQITRSQRAWLTGQLDNWQSRELLSADQAANVLKLYTSQAELADRSRSRVMMALMGVAAFLIGLGVLLLVGYNWQAMPSWVKLVIIFSVIAATQTIGLFLRFKRGSKLLSEAVFFFACFLYGIGIFLVAQIFHLNAHYPDGFWWWAVGVLPIALCMDTLLLHVLLVSLLAIWCHAELFNNLNLGMFTRWDAIPGVAYSLPMLVLPGLVWGYRKKSLLSVYLYVLLFSWWVVLQSLEGRWDCDGLALIGIVGGWMLVVSECHCPRDRFAIPFRLSGFLLVASVLMIMSIHEVNVHTSQSEPNISNRIMALAIVVLSGMTVAVAAFRQSQSRASANFGAEILKLTKRQCLPLGLVLLFATFSYVPTYLGEPLLKTLAANIAILSLAGWLASLGIREDRGLPFLIGILYFLLWAVIRYIDLFGDFGGMLGAALLFFVCGGILLGLAWYWSNRRRIQHV